MTGAETVDPRVIDERLELPFDQYQRYQVTAELLEGFEVPAGSLILEVGGGPGPLETFLPELEVFVSDITGEHVGRFMLADGAALPFADQTFAAVVTLDVLEHVPPQFRKPFLAELLRVSADLVVLSAPFTSPELVLAEEALNEFIRARFQGDFPTLDEHADNGLPELEPTAAALGADGFSAVTLPSGYLPRWLMGMLLHHELLATGLPHLGKLPRVLQLGRVATRLSRAVVPPRRGRGPEPTGGRGRSRRRSAALARRPGHRPGRAQRDRGLGALAAIERRRPIRDPGTRARRRP